MIAAPHDRRPVVGAPRADATVAGGVASAGAGDPELAPLLARLLTGEPLDRDERGAIVGEVLRLWALEARRGAGLALGADRGPDYSSPRSFAANRA